MVVRTYFDREGHDSGLLAMLAHRQVGRAVPAMVNDPARSWTLAELASCANASRASLVRMFRGLAQQSPVAFLTELRLELARRKLSATALPIAAIADEVGYNSESAFSRAFRRRFGMRPGETRAGASPSPLSLSGRAAKIGAPLPAIAGETLQLDAPSRMRMPCARSDRATNTRSIETGPFLTPDAWRRPLQPGRRVYRRRVRRRLAPVRAQAFSWPRRRSRSPVRLRSAKVSIGVSLRPADRRRDACHGRIDPPADAKHAGSLSTLRAYLGNQRKSAGSRLDVRGNPRSRKI
jgi:AraC-like DNA-binding protein